MNYVIQSPELKVTVSDRGAELQSLHDGQTEYLWQGDARYWADRALTIFPYVARLTGGKYTLDGQEYRMDIHGFAPKSCFSLLAKRENSLTLRLTDTELTRTQFPFSFVFDVTYTVENTRLSVMYRVENHSSAPMYFGIGGHPGFFVPNCPGLCFEDYRLEFAGPCRPRRVLFSDDCFVTGGDEPLALEEDRILRLRHTLFDHDAIVMKEMSRAVSLFSPKGGKRITVSFPDMPYLGLWHAPRTDAPYVCIEPWSSLPSRQNVVEDLARQPDLNRLDAGGVYVNTWTIGID